MVTGLKYSYFLTLILNDLDTWKGKFSLMPHAKYDCGPRIPSPYQGDAQVRAGIWRDITVRIGGKGIYEPSWLVFCRIKERYRSWQSLEWQQRHEQGGQQAGRFFVVVLKCSYNSQRWVVPQGRYLFVLNDLRSIHQQAYIRLCRPEQPADDLGNLFGECGNVPGSCNRADGRWNHRQYFPL